jgi:UDPglucose 6-dehydrogenase
MEEAKKSLEKIEWCNDPYEVAKGADALVIITEWNEFRGLDLTKLGEIMNTKLIVDMRNIYKPAEMREAGFHYVSIGRPPVEIKKQETKLKKVS